MIDYELVKTPYSFIQSTTIPEDVCDGVVDFWRDHREDPMSSQGITGKGTVDKTAKDSFDVSTDMLQRDERIKSYLSHLKISSDRYLENYPILKKMPWSLVEGFNIQHYAPGGGYHAEHFERGYWNGIPSSRILVWMTYLNDVVEGGETEFSYFDLRVKPKKGLTLIWPADWTHAHKGIVAPNEDKYIITGWYNYLQ